MPSWRALAHEEDKKDVALCPAADPSLTKFSVVPLAE